MTPQTRKRKKKPRSTARLVRTLEHRSRGSQGADSCKDMVIYAGMYVTLSIGADTFAASGARVVSVITTGSGSVEKWWRPRLPGAVSTMERRYITTAFFRTQWSKSEPFDATPPKATDHPLYECPRLRGIKMPNADRLARRQPFSPLTPVNTSSKRQLVASTRVLFLSFFFCASFP